MREPTIASIGKKYGRLYVHDIFRKEIKTYTKVFAKCTCDCGAQVDVLLPSLRSGLQVSCGCSRNERVSNLKRTHGLSGSRIYIVWKGMLARCYNKKNKRFKDYGGRGIAVSDEWHLFENFYADMGDQGPLMTLDRINNDLGYSKENCQWSTTKTNNRNRRSNRFFILNGERKALSEWCEIYRAERSLVRYRIDVAGWDFYTALTTPSRRKHDQGRLCEERETN